MNKSVLMMSAALAAGSLFAWDYDQVDKVDIDPLEENAGTALV